MKPIDDIREAFYKIHDYATGKSRTPYMSIPADDARDADIILSTAIDELKTLRDTMDRAVELREQAVAQAEHFLAEKEAAKALVVNLNEKLDATHSHRCFKCETTVTEKTAARQAAERKSA